MTTSSKPDKIIISSLEWSIEWNAKLKSDTLGLCDAALYTIKISNALEAEDAIRSTLLHEIMHAIYFTYGFRPSQKDSHDHEEEVVAFLSSALFDTLLRNPAVLSYIFSTTKPARKTSAGN